MVLQRLFNRLSSILDEGRTKDIEGLRKTVSRGDRLENLKKQEGWSDLMDIKEYGQTLADRLMRNLESDEKLRFRGAIEWNGIEAPFREMERRIKLGKESRNKLAELTGQKLPS